MTLHEAIEKLLRSQGRAMTTSQIAEKLNKNKWYSKKDNSAITAFQVHGRTRKHPELFLRKGSTVTLTGRNLKARILTSNRSVSPILKTKQIPFPKLSFKEESLLSEQHFKSAKLIDELVSRNAGLYCIRLKKGSKLPTPFDNHLKTRGHNIIYIGIASKSLHQRFLNQELRANGHGTFFRSIGAILGYRPERGSLATKTNKRNYTFNPTDEVKIINWINENLMVNWVELNEGFDQIETQLLKKHNPLLNIAKNPAALKELSILRSECVRIANGI
jgi:hypothetical protein